MRHVHEQKYTSDIVRLINNWFIHEVKCELCASVGLTPLAGGPSVSWSTLTGPFIRRAGSSILTVTGERAVGAPAALCTNAVTVNTCADTQTQILNL